MADEPKESVRTTPAAMPPHRTAEPFGAFVCGLFFLASALFTRGGLHDEVNGIVMLIWLVLGVFATRLALAVWRPPRWPGMRVMLRRSGFAVTALGWILGGIIIFGPPHDPHALDQRMQGRCAMHLRFLGTLIVFYAQDHGDRYPDRPEVLLGGSGGFAESFICPSTGDTPATGATPAEIADSFSSGGHFSYIYVGKGLTTATTRPDTVLMYEPLRNHTRDHPGIHVLYADGHVDYLQDDAARELTLRMWERAMKLKTN